MSRPLRIHVPGGFYHVTLRGNHRQDIFFSAADRRLLDDLTAEVLARFSARLHAYCWMTNHIHMLLQVGDEPLSRLILNLAGRYARTVQWRLDTTGHLFEKRFHSVLVDADAYLLQLTRYIHLNPVRAQLVGHPTHYQWSSHRAYLGRTAPAWVTTEFVLRMFHSDRARAIRAYADHTEAAIADPGPSPLLECNRSDARILGSDDFARRTLGAAWRPRSRKALDDLVQEATTAFSVSRSALISNSSERRLTKARAWIAHNAVESGAASRSEVARLFNRSETALRKSVKAHFKVRPR